jgi:hypothetical protein
MLTWRSGVLTLEQVDYNSNQHSIICNLFCFIQLLVLDRDVLLIFTILKRFNSLDKTTQDLHDTGSLSLRNSP